MPGVFKIKKGCLTIDSLFQFYNNFQICLTISKFVQDVTYQKDIDEFNFRNKSKGTKHSYCKDCGKLYTQSHYKKNKNQYLSRNSRTFSKRREIIQQLKSCPCKDCGIQYPYYVMDFDHREDEVKELQINQIVRYTIEKLKMEIAKCDVVCSNCHRERTFQRLSKKLNKF